MLVRLKILSWKPFGSLLDALWGALGTSGSLLGGSWEALGPSWKLLGGFLEPFGDHMGALEGSQAVMRVILEAAGCILGPLEAVLEPLGAFWGSYGSSGMLPGSHVGDLGGCWTHLGASWSALGASWKGLGRLLGGSWEHF